MLIRLVSFLDEELGTSMISSMCCFSKNVESVSATRIFARMMSPGHQGLAYQMNFSSAEDMAMILPIPVPPGTIP